MDQNISMMLAITVPTVAVLIGIIVNNSRLSDVNGRLSDMNNRLSDMSARITEMRTYVDHRLEDMKNTFSAHLHRVEGVLDARLSHIEDRLGIR